MRDFVFEMIGMQISLHSFLFISQTNVYIQNQLSTQAMSENKKVSDILKHLKKCTNSSIEKEPKNEIEEQFCCCLVNSIQFVM